MRSFSKVCCISLGLDSVTSASDLKRQSVIQQWEARPVLVLGEGASAWCPAAAGCLQTHALSWVKGDNTLAAHNPVRKMLWMEPGGILPSWDSLGKTVHSSRPPICPSRAASPLSMLLCPGPPLGVGISGVAMNYPSQVRIKTLKKKKKRIPKCRVS